MRMENPMNHKSCLVKSKLHRLRAFAKKFLDAKRDLPDMSRLMMLSLASAERAISMTHASPGKKVYV